MWHETKDRRRVLHDGGIDNDSKMKQIEVVAAIIHDAEGRIFATQRGNGEWKAANKRGQNQTCLSYAERKQARPGRLHSSKQTNQINEDERQTTTI